MVFKGLFGKDQFFAKQLLRNKPLAGIENNAERTEMRISSVAASGDVQAVMLFTGR